MFQTSISEHCAADTETINLCKKYSHERKHVVPAQPEDPRQGRRATLSEWGVATELNFQGKEVAPSERVG